MSPGIAALLIGLVWLSVLPRILELRRRPMSASLRRQAPGRIVRLGRGRTHVIEAGDAGGPVVICIHGSEIPSYVFGGLMPVLTELGFHAIAYDLYGRGFSDRPRGRHGHRFYGAQLEELIEEEGLAGQELVLVGYGMGAAIAAGYAARANAQVSAMVVIAPAGLELPKLAWWQHVPVFATWAAPLFGYGQMRGRVRDLRARPSAVTGIAGRVAVEMGRRGYLPALTRSARQFLPDDTAPFYQRIAVRGIPVLAVWGSEDKDVPLSAMGRLAEADPDVVQIQIDGAGHGLVHTHPGEVGQAVAAFLAGR